MGKMVNFILCVFYHSEKIEGVEDKKKEKTGIVWISLISFLLLEFLSSQVLSGSKQF